MRADRQHGSPELLRPPIPMVRDRSDPREVFVSTKRILISCVVGWPIVVVMMLTARLALVDPGPSAAEFVGWVFVVAAPVLTGVIIARGRSSQSIAQVLYDVEHPRQPGRMS
jgi:hypothetical protein